MKIYLKSISLVIAIAFLCNDIALALQKDSSFSKGSAGRGAMLAEAKGMGRLVGNAGVSSVIIERWFTFPKGVRELFIDRYGQSLVIMLGQIEFGRKLCHSEACDASEQGLKLHRKIIRSLEGEVNKLGGGFSEFYVDLSSLRVKVSREAYLVMEISDGNTAEIYIKGMFKKRVRKGVKNVKGRCPVFKYMKLDEKSGWIMRKGSSGNGWGNGNGRDDGNKRRNGDGYIRSKEGNEAFREFNVQLAEIRKNDITEKYRERIGRLVERLDSRLRGNDEVRRATEDISTKYKIYGFSGIVKGKEDYFLGWNNAEAKELFIAEDLIAELEAFASPSLVDEYLLHEILCPVLGHYETIKLQQQIFPEHYTPQALNKHPKGLLGKVLRDYIDFIVDFKRTMDLAHTMNLESVRNHLMDPSYINYLMAVKRTVNPDGKPFVGVYGGAGADISNFLLSTNAVKGYLVDNSYGSQERRFTKDKMMRYLFYKRELGYVSNNLVDSCYFSAILLELRTVGVAEEDIRRIKRQRKEYVKNKGNITIEFDWKYPGEAETKKRTIHLVRADITAVPDYPQVLKDALDAGIDFYYQKAGAGIPKNYGLFIQRIVDSLKQGGFLITDDYLPLKDIMFNPLQTLRKGQMARVPPDGDIKYWEDALSIRWEGTSPYSLRYGSFVSLYKKVSGGTQARTGGTAAMGKYKSIEIKSIQNLPGGMVRIIVLVEEIGGSGKGEIILYGRRRAVAGLTSFKKTGIRRIDAALNKTLSYLKRGKCGYVLEIERNSYRIYGLSAMFNGAPVIGIHELYFSNPVAQFHELAHLADIKGWLSLEQVLEHIKKMARCEARLRKYFPAQENIPPLVKFHYALRQLQSECFCVKDRNLTDAIKTEVEVPVKSRGSIYSIKNLSEDDRDMLSRDLGADNSYVQRLTIKEKEALRLLLGAGGSERLSIRQIAEREHKSGACVSLWVLDAVRKWKSARILDLEHTNTPRDRERVLVLPVAHLPVSGKLLVIFKRCDIRTISGLLSFRDDWRKYKGVGRISFKEIMRIINLLKNKLFPEETVDVNAEPAVEKPPPVPPVYISAGGPARLPDGQAVPIGRQAFTPVQEEEGLKRERRKGFLYELFNRLPKYGNCIEREKREAVIDAIVDRGELPDGWPGLIELLRDPGDIDEIKNIGIAVKRYARPRQIPEKDLVLAVGIIGRAYLMKKRRKEGKVPLPEGAGQSGHMDLPEIQRALDMWEGSGNGEELAKAA